MCSRSEGFGRVTVEYMMAGLPVLASDTGANPELVTDRVTGYLYHYANVTDLKEKLEHMINHREETHIMGLNAFQAASIQFTERKNAENILRLYEEFM